ncbi:MAG: LON peptidase substrate-binding domain-containing protein [Actinomycetota bacterium]|nr:LON peptidase substrate-binding domain-containing protein [Actinomycetota bacterium]
MTAPAGVALPLPMFPLGAVLFPHMVLPLHVFEPRYRALARDCLRHGQEFGVVLIERGSEVGGGDSRFGVATVAHITEATEFPDGRWALVCVGTRRVRVVTWLPDDPYPLALVENLAEAPLDRPALEALAEADRAVRRALALSAELDQPAIPATVELDADPSVAAYQLAAIAPLGPVDQQRVLEHDDPTARLRLLTELAVDVATVLAYRLSAG